MRSRKKNQVNPVNPVKKMRRKGEIRRYGIGPKKSLSQSFLKSEGMAKKIVESLPLEEGDVVVEVGPGTGVLTKFLLKKSNRVIVIEKDRCLVRVLKEIFEKARNLTIVEGDILKVDMGSILSGEKAKIVSNLPFSISKQFLYALLENRDLFSHAVLTLQREVARRLVGKPNTKLYGTLSVVYHCFSKTEVLFPIPPSFFYPRPKVSSLVVRIEFPDNPGYPVDDYGNFLNFVKTCFARRRKMLRNTIGLEGPMGEKRAEELSPSDFVNLWCERKSR